MMLRFLQKEKWQNHLHWARRIVNVSIWSRFLARLWASKRMRIGLMRDNFFDILNLQRIIPNLESVYGPSFVLRYF